MSNTAADKLSSNTNDDSDFVLKHRIVGAAFLLFFGALVLPWLLGPPSEASKQPSVERLANSDRTGLPADIENEILAALEDKAAEEERVYISKITPLDGKKGVTTNIGTSLATENSEDKKPPQPSDKVVEAVNASNAKTTDKEQAKKTDNNVADTSKTKSDEQSSKVNDVAKAKKAAAENIDDKKSTKATKTDDKISKAAQDLAAALQAESIALNSGVDVGWIVQVGVFTDKTGVSKVVKDLTGKGFRPRTSVVDTNRGKGTGTRIWLGPFEQRVEAAKTKTRLTERTGESGFIRAYP